MNKRGVALNGRAREIVCNVDKYFESEKKRSLKLIDELKIASIYSGPDRNIMLTREVYTTIFQNLQNASKVSERVYLATGINKNTLTRIRREARDAEASSSIITTPKKKKRGALNNNASNEVEDKQGSIKVVQLADLQKPTSNKLEDSDEISDKMCMEDDEESDSSGSISDSAANGSQDDRTHVCDVCDFRFQHSSQLSLHRLTHTDERPFAPSDKLHVHTKIEREDPVIDVAIEVMIKREDTGSEGMSRIKRTTHPESGHPVFTASADVMLSPHAAHAHARLQAHANADAFTNEYTTIKRENTGSDVISGMERTAYPRSGHLVSTAGGDLPPPHVSHSHAQAHTHAHPTANEVTTIKRENTGSEGMFGMECAAYPESGHLVFTASEYVKLPQHVAHAHAHTQVQAYAHAAPAVHAHAHAPQRDGLEPGRGSRRPCKTPRPLTAKIKKR
ncbi:unnamed protein product, partial [Iphiclides podalirius]